MKFWTSWVFIALGVILGLIGLVALRVSYYNAMEMTPNMHPAIAFYFLPVLVVVVLLVATPLEALLRRWSSVPTTPVHAILVGVAHVSLLVWWAFPMHWFVVLLINPVTARWLVTRLLIRR